MYFKIRQKDMLKIFLISSVILLLIIGFVISETITSLSLMLYIIGLGLLTSTILLVNKYDFINVTVVFLASFLLLLGFGPIILYFLGFIYYKYLMALYTISLGAFFLGYLLLGKLIKKHVHFKNVIYADNYRNRNVFWAELMYLLGVLATVVYLYINRYYFFASSLNDGRISALSGNGSLIYIGRLMWLGVFICCEEHLKTKRFRKRLIIMCFLAILCSLLTGFRSTVIDSILVLLVMWNKEKPIKQELLITTCLIILAFAMFYAIFRDGAFGSVSAIDKLLEELRVCSVNINYICEAFPKKIPFQKGYTYLINLIMLAPGPQLDFTLWLKDVLNLKFSGGGVAPTIIGEFYINWGIIGIIVGMTLWGTLFRYVQIAYRKGNSIFLPSLMIGYLRSFVRGGMANSMIVLTIYIGGYLFCHGISKYFHLKIR